MKSKITILCILSVLFIPAVSMATIIVYFDPCPLEIVAGDSFTVDVFANIPTTDGVMAYSLGIEYNESLMELDEIILSNNFEEVTNNVTTGEFSGGQLVPLWGDLLLATVSFCCLGEGDSVLDIASGSFSRGGFLLDPPEWLSTPCMISQTSAPVPEPSTMLLLGGGLAGLAFYRRKRK